MQSSMLRPVQQPTKSGATVECPKTVHNAAATSPASFSEPLVTVSVDSPTVAVPTDDPNEIETITSAVVDELVETVTTATPPEVSPPAASIGDVLAAVATSTKEETTAMLCEALGADPKALDTLKVAELRTICTHLSISTSGKKSEIKSRIAAYHRKLTTET